MTPLKRALDTILSANEKLFGGTFSIESHTYYPEKDKISAGLTTDDKDHKREVFLLTVTSETKSSEQLAEGYLVEFGDQTNTAKKNITAGELDNFLRHAKVTFPTNIEPLKISYGEE